MEDSDRLAERLREMRYDDLASLVEDVDTIGELKSIGRSAQDLASIIESEISRRRRNRRRRS